MATLDKAFEEGTIARLVAPILGTLNIEPEATDLGSRRVQVRDSSLHLSYSVTTVGAWEALQVL